MIFFAHKPKIEQTFEFWRLILKSLAIILNVLLVSISSFAATTVHNVSLDEAVKLAKENSEDLELSIQAIENNESIYREVLGTALPQLTFDATWQKYFMKPVFFGNAVDLNYQLSSTLSVSQTLWAFGRVGAAIDAAKAGKQLGELDKQLTEDQIEYLARAAYYSALFSKKNLEIANQSLASAKQNLSILQQKFSGGRPPQSDLVRLQADVASRIPQVKTAELNYKQAKWSLAQVIGVSLEEEVNLTTKFDQAFKVLAYDKLKEKLNDKVPSIQALDQSIAYAAESAKVYNAADLPTITAVAAYSYAGAGSDPLTSEDLRSSSYAGVNISWNIWDGGSTRAKAQQARINKKIAELTKKKQLEGLELKLAQTWKTYQTLVESHDSAKKAVQLAERSFKIAQKRFRTGQTSLTEMNSTDLALTQARIGLAQNIFAIHDTLAQLANVLSLNPGELL